MSCLHPLRYKKIMGLDASENETVTKSVTEAARIYRTKWWRRAVPIFLVALGLLFLTGLIERGVSEVSQQQIISLLGVSAFLLLGIFMTGDAFRSTITLTADAIEVRTLLRSSQLPLNAIRGRREYVVNSGRTRTRYLRLESNDDRLPALYFEKSFSFDTHFFAWFNALPDLDELDKSGLKTSEFGLV